METHAKRPGLLAALLAAAIGTGVAHAYDFSALKPEGCVSDFARVVDAGTRLDLEIYCGKLGEAAGARILLVTVRSLEGQPRADVARLLFQKWEAGKDRPNGALLLLFGIRERAFHLETSGGAARLVSGEDLLVAMRPALQGRHYGDALILAARRIGAGVERVHNTAVAGAPRTRRAPEGQSRLGILAGVLLGGGAVAMALLAIARRRSDKGETAWCDCAGGFGGYDSGDSFGGFGGAKR